MIYLGLICWTDASPGLLSSEHLFSVEQVLANADALRIAFNDYAF